MLREFLISEYKTFVKIRSHAFNVSMTLFIIFSLTFLGIGTYGVLYTPYIGLFAAMVCIGSATTFILLLMCSMLVTGYCLNDLDV